ncbi:GmrSD restriction endonuclease domain-containing protein [Geoglobus ahangari]
MEIEWSKKKLLELVRKAYNGEVMLPDFQRNFVWARNDIEELICSLLEKMFIGTFLIQRVSPTNVPFKVIPIEGADKINGNFTPRPEIIVLDGQQRLTSLFYALYSPDIPLKNTTNPYVFFIDLQELCKDNIEDAVFSWSKQWREYKSLLDGNGKYNLRELTKRKILPLTFLSDDDEFGDLWHEHYKNLFSKEDAKKVKSYLDNLRHYEVHVLSIPLTEKPEDIAILFERINRTGIKLSIFDLLTARLYKFINLRTEWERTFNENYWIRQIASNDVKNTKIPYYVIQGLALSRGMGIKARDIMKIDSYVLNQTSWNNAIEILENKILSRLFDVSEYGIADYKWLSYPSMISIWLGLFIMAENGEIEIDINKINRWYWSVIFTERYSGSTETKQTKDFKDLVEWIKDDSKVPEAVVDAQAKLSIMKLDTKYSGSSIYKGVFNLLFKKGAWDFYEKDKIKFSVKYLEDHHIFPRKFLESKNVKVEKDVILNRTLILSSTNRRISKKAPATYLREMLEIHGSEDNVKRILEKHFINDEMFEILKNVKEDSTPEEIKESFEQFVSMREDLIKTEIKKHIV